eukprot:6481726-Amphidinium_carterae.1
MNCSPPSFEISISGHRRFALLRVLFVQHSRYQWTCTRTGVKENGLQRKPYLEIIQNGELSSIANRTSQGCCGKLVASWKQCCKRYWTSYHHELQLSI